MLFASWALIASFLAAYYWLQYTDVNNRIRGALITINLGIDYGNSSRTWQNDTKALTGQTLFDVTKLNANVTYDVGSNGPEVKSINGLGKQGNSGWTYWILNATSNSWSIVWESADKYLITNEETFMWYYQSSFNPPP